MNVPRDIALIGLLALSAGGGGERLQGAAERPAADAGAFTQVRFDGCTADEQRILREALRTAASLATRAQGDLYAVAEAERPTFARYRTWFGAYDAGRYNRLAARYGQVAATATGPILFDCTGRGTCAGAAVGCDPGDVAFTCAGGDGRRIWPCAGFWLAPDAGRSSRPGTLVRKLANWYGIRGNDYDCKAAQAIAQENPDKAAGNGDSWQYFAEDAGLSCD